MTDTVAAPAPPQDRGGGMSWNSLPRRVVTLYMPLVCFVFVLLFPFYWMTVTTLKPDHELYDRSEEHTSELQSLMRISYAVFCLKKKITMMHKPHHHTPDNTTY